ncbi:MAG: lactonase family protein [Thermoguttaceae bacterium]|jgi:6-phosphogluconolactonase
MKHCRILTVLGMLSLGAAVCGAAGSTPPPSKEKPWLVYIGTFTNAKGKGIYCSRLDRATGSLQPSVLAAETRSPSFLALNPNGSVLYAVHEIGDFAGHAGAISAFAIDKADGRLKLLNQQSTCGPGPCHLALDRRGQCIIAANYSGGSVACLPIRAGGRLGPATCFVQHAGSSINRQRQEGPHAHCVTLEAGDHFAFVADLGLDKILAYRLDAAQGKLTANQPASTLLAAGSGPRHFVFHPNGRYAYAINELASTVVVFSYDAQRGALDTLQTISTLPPGFAGSNTTAEVAIHPSGKFLYGSNRGHDSIAIFAIDAAAGKLRSLGHEATQGKTPRHFAIDPSGRYLLAANQDGNSVVVFRIDADSGRLQATGSRIAVPSPVCIVVTPSD